MQNRDVVDVHCTITGETDKAYRISVDHLDEEVWVPLSQCEIVHKNPKGQDWITMSRWIAEKKGLIE